MTKRCSFFLAALAALAIAPAAYGAGDGELARELSNAGYPHISAAVLRPAIQMLKAESFGNGDWMVSVYEKSGDESFVLELLNSHAFEQLGASIKGLARLLKAKQFLEEGQFDQAVRYIQSHPVEGPFRNRYEYLRGNALAQAKQFKAAIEVFKSLSENTDASDEGRLRNLAILGLARTYHEIEDYAAAVYNYNRIGVLDPEFPEATFEKGWSFFLFDMVNGALGSTLTFKAPQFAHEFFPEIFIVRAASFYRLCYYDRAIDELRELKLRYEPVRVEVKNILNEIKNEKSFIAALEDRRARTLSPLLLNFFVQDPDFRVAFSRYKTLVSERTRFLSGGAGRSAAWGGRIRSLAERAFQEGEKQFSGEIKDRLERLEVSLDSVISKGELIEIEVLKTKEQQLKGEKTKGELQARKLQLDDYEVDELIHVWKFIGEFWLDELGSYYYGLASSCQEAGATL